MTNKDKIDEIREAIANATPAPWEVQNLRDIYTPTGAMNRSGVKADDNDGWHIADTICGPTNVNGVEERLSFAERQANTYLIAKAPVFIMFLLSELDRVNEALQSTQQDKERLIEGLKQEHKDAQTWDGYRVMERIEKLLAEFGVTL